MHSSHLDDWQHDHVFGQDRKRLGEVRTLLIVILTAVMMVVEVAAGLMFGSMALLAAKYFGATWLDPAMGVVGAALVAHWSLGLIRDSARVLRDYQVRDGTDRALRQALEGDSGDRVCDLHVWRIGHGLNAAAIGLVADEHRAPGEVRARIPAHLNIVHSTIEVHRCPGTH